MNHFLPEKCVTRPSIFNWLWRGSHQKSANGRNFSFSCLCKIYITAINGILAFCSYVIIDSQTPIFGKYYSSKTYIQAIWMKFFKKLRKTQTSLGIRPVWTESLLCAQWVGKGSALLQADSEDSEQSAQADLSLRCAHSQGLIEIETGVILKKLIVNIFLWFSWFLYQMKELKKYSLHRRYKTMSETHKLRKG